MRIYDYSCDYRDGREPTVTLGLFDVSSKEMLHMRDLAARGENIKIERDDPWGDWITSIITKTETANNYARRDAEMAATLYGRTKIEFTPRDIKVEKVIFNKPATIIFWSDNTKTVVVCGENDTYDKEKGFYIACAKKLFGNDYKAVGRMNKALEMAVVQTKLERMTMDDVLLSEEAENDRS